MPELGKVRLAPENFLDALEFLRRETVFRDELRSDRRIGKWGHRLRTLADAIRGSTREASNSRKGISQA